MSCSTFLASGALFFMRAKPGENKLGDDVQKAKKYKKGEGTEETKAEKMNNA